MCTFTPSAHNNILQPNLPWLNLLKPVGIGKTEWTSHIHGFVLYIVGRGSHTGAQQRKESVQFVYIKTCGVEGGKKN